jgi:hypothetical protein
MEQVMNAQAEVVAFDGRNMTPFDDAISTLDDLYGEAANWADGTPIENDDQLAALDALDRGLLEVGKRLDALRVEEKRPFDDGAKAVQAKFKPHLDRGDRARAVLNKPRADYKAKREAERKAAAEKAAAEARAIEEAQRKAEEAARAGDLAAAERAAELEADLAAADDAAKRMAKAAKGPTGLRTVYRAELVDPKAAFNHYWKTERQAFTDLIQSLADRDVRAPATRYVPGFKIHEERKAL